AAVLVASVRALRSHASAPDPRGFANLDRHISNLGKFGVPVVVALNRFPADEMSDLDAIRAFCAERGVPCALTEAFARGGEGAMELAARVIDATSGEPADVHPLYAPELSLIEKVETIAREIY